MSNYRREMLVLVTELHNKSNKSKTEAGREKYRRQAEVLEFIVLHPEGLAELFASQEKELSP